jgi:hypothetical protein
MSKPGNPYGTERGTSTINLLVLTSSDHVPLLQIFVFLFYNVTYLREEVNSTEPSTSVSVPCSKTFVKI